MNGGLPRPRLTQMSRRPDEPENSLFFLNYHTNDTRQNTPYNPKNRTQILLQLSGKFKEFST